MKKIALIFVLLLFLTPVACLGDSISAIGPAVKLRAAPGAESKAVAFAGGGKTFNVVQTKGSGWFAVRLPNKQLGWVELSPEVKLKRAPIVTKPPAKKTPAAKKTPVVKKPKKKVEKKPQVVAAREVKTKGKPPPAPPKTVQPKETPVEKKEKGGFPKFIPTVEMDKPLMLLAKAPIFLAGIGILFGLLCLVVAKVKSKSLLNWFTLGLYLTIIPVIILLVKKKGEGTGPTVLKILSIIFLVIWLGLMGGLYMFTQSLMQDKDTIQQKVNLYTKQIHKKSYKGAHLLLSPEGQRLLPLKRFVKQNETAYNALGSLKHYQLKDFTFAITYEAVNVSLPLLKGPRIEEIPISLDDKPTTIVYMGVFEKGRGQITFTLEKEGALMEKLKPGQWGIKSVLIDSPKILEYKRQMKKEEMQKKEAQKKTS